MPANQNLQSEYLVNFSRKLIEMKVAGHVAKIVTSPNDEQSNGINMELGTGANFQELILFSYWI